MWKVSTFGQVSYLNRVYNWTTDCRVVSFVYRLVYRFVARFFA